MEDKPAQALPPPDPVVTLKAKIRNLAEDLTPKNVKETRVALLALVST